MIAGSLFIAASITDYLDGYLARAWNETSSFGRLLDPIADKLLVATALVVIITKTYVEDGQILHYYTCNMTIIAAFVILCREILVSGLREFLREVNVGLPVTKLAKWKTAFQMTALAMMLFCELSRFWVNLGEFLLWVAAVLTFITGYQYYQKSLEYVKSEEAQKIVAAKIITAVKTKAETKAPAKTKTAAKAPAEKTAAAKKTAVKKKSVSKKTADKKPAKAKKTATRKTAAKAKASPKK